MGTCILPVFKCADVQVFLIDFYFLECEVFIKQKGTEITIRHRTY